MTVNALGCFLVGFFATVSADKFYWGVEGRILLMVGFCGAFTTFSAFILETANLIKDGETMKAFLNVALSIVLSFLTLWLGIRVGELVTA